MISNLQHGGPLGVARNRPVASPAPRTSQSSKKTLSLKSSASERPRKKKTPVQEEYLVDRRDPPETKGTKKKPKLQRKVFQILKNIIKD